MTEGNIDDLYADDSTWQTTAKQTNCKNGALPGERFTVDFVKIYKSSPSNWHFQSLSHQVKQSDSHQTGQWVTLFSSLEKWLATTEVMSRSTLYTSALKEFYLQLKSYTYQIYVLYKNHITDQVSQ